jgi:hypothetical protein
MFDTVCGTANFDSSEHVPPTIADTYFAGSKRCRIECRFPFVDSRTMPGRRRSVGYPVGNVQGWHTCRSVDNAAAGRDLLAPDTSPATPGAFALAAGLEGEVLISLSRKNLANLASQVVGGISILPRLRVSHRW